MSRLRATYRIQMGGDVDFAFVKSLVPYLRSLGISHLYLSPSLQARSGSTHGYDVVDPRKVSEALGGEQGLRELRSSGLGIVLDIVPNHMGTGDENPWWSHDELRPRFFDVDEKTGFYRRFFDIDDLAALRMERDEVFDLVHNKVLDLFKQGVLDGVRVDHPDGLADPAGYFERLRAAGFEQVWIEKILHPGEPMREWPVTGTVGYEFLVDVCALFVDPAAEAAMTALYTELVGDPRSFEEVAEEAQREQALGTFAREVDWLARLAPDLDRDEIAGALADLPIYRTYVEPWSGKVDPLDAQAVSEAGITGRLADILLLRERGFDEFVTRFQQTSPPVTAKGIEDTAFYRYVRLVALNEVGNDPGRFGIGVHAFHATNAERARRFPQNLLITSTHDTKRSADTRARIGALASIPDDWARAAREMFTATEELVSGGAPDANERYWIFQTLVGAWPIDAERLEAYVEKALREAKRNTNWVDQNHPWEDRVKAFAVALLDHRPFLDVLEPLLERVVPIGDRHALGYVLLKLTSPGVPDIYQGDELPFLALVDPDNRRPVDWDERRAAIDAPPGAAGPKFDLIRRVLALREERPFAFERGYEPLEAGADTCAFVRGGGEVLVVCGLRDDPDAIVTLPRELDGTWRGVLDDRTHELRAGPVAVRDLVDDNGMAVLARAS